MSFTISNHNKTKRVQIINIKHQDLDRLIFPFKKHTITSLEYKPFSRFSLAKSLDEVFENKLGIELKKILNAKKIKEVSRKALKLNYNKAVQLISLIP